MECINRHHCALQDSGQRDTCYWARWLVSRHSWQAMLYMVYHHSNLHSTSYGYPTIPEGTETERLVQNGQRPRSDTEWNNYPINQCSIVISKMLFCGGTGTRCSEYWTVMESTNSTRSVTTDTQWEAGYSVRKSGYNVVYIYMNFGLALSLFFIQTWKSGNRKTVSVGLSNLSAKYWTFLSFILSYFRRPYPYRHSTSSLPMGCQRLAATALQTFFCAAGLASQWQVAVWWWQG